MARAGILREHDRVELIDGDVLAMGPIGRRHAGVCNRLTRLFVSRLGERAIVQIQASVRLGRSDEPQPDLVVFRPRDDFYETGERPSADDILLVVELADSSIHYDSTVKAGLYARHGLREYWVVDLNRQVVLRHTDAGDGRYHRVETIEPGVAFAPLTLPDLALTIEDIFGRQS